MKPEVVDIQRQLNEPYIEHFTRRFVTVGGIRLSFVEMGSGPPLILLHGFPQNSYCWRCLMPELAKRYRVIAFDLKGYGESDKPASGYDLRTLTDELRQVVHELGYDTASWIGHDWGGMLVWGVVLRFPEIVDRFVIINAAFHRIHPLHLAHIYATWVPGLAEWVITRFPWMLPWSMRFYAYDRRSLSRGSLAVYRKQFESPEVLHGSLAYYRSIVRSAIQLMVWRWRKIRRPCLILWGAHDFALPVNLLKGIERYFKAPLRIELIPQCGHWVMEERPERVLELLAGFL